MVALGGHVQLLLGGMHGCSGGACMVAAGGDMRGCSGGHVWLFRGGMCGCSWGVCMVAPRGGVHGCSGGHAWLLQGACVVALGRVCGCSEGHVWLLWGGCMVAPGGGHARDMTRYGDMVNERAVYILLECILVCFVIGGSKEAVFGKHLAPICDILDLSLFLVKDFDYYQNYG